MESIYERIRLLRAQQNMTLKELSEKTGLSISFLSQVERGNSSLAITSLQKIAEVLNVPMSSFFEEPVHNTYLTLEAERKQLKIERSNAIYNRLAGDFVGRALEPLYVTLEPRSTQDIAFNHQGEEFYYILQGKVVMTIGEQEFELQAGDAIHFPSLVDHSWYNPTDEPVHMISVLTPVIFRS